MSKITYWILIALDVISNFILGIYSFCFYYILVFFKETKSFKYPSNLTFQYLQDFTTMNEAQLASLYNKRLWWGDFDPTQPQTFQDPNGVVLTSRGLELSITNTSKVFNGVTANHGRGIVQSNVTYKGGFFEFNVMLPTGQWTWPALWVEDDPFPGEIDFLECFADANGKFGRNINTNVHISESVNEINLNTTHCGWFLKPEKVLNVKMYWTPTKVKIWFNNLPVRVIRNKYIFSYINKSNGLSLIMNNNIRKDIGAQPFVGEPFIVKDFKYSTVN